MIVELYLKHKKLMRQLTQTDIISDTATRDWTQRYQQGGTEGLRKHRTWKHYSQVLKEQQAIRDYLEAKTSQYCDKTIFLAEAFSKMNKTSY